MKINNIVVGNTEPANTNDLWLNPEDGFKYFGNSGWTSAGGSAKTIKWTETSKLSDFLEPGIYVCENTKRYTLDDELPITNVYGEDSKSSYISFTLIVNKAVSFQNPPNKYENIGQTLILTNREGDETKQYIRTLKHVFNQINNDWTLTNTAWKELKGTLNLNSIESADLDNYTENGLYEGVILNNADFSGAPNIILNTIMGAIQAFIVQTNDVENENKCWLLPTGSLFTMEVKNNYAIESVAADMGVIIERKVTQIVKLQLLNGLYAEVSRFSINNLKNWTPWYNVALYGQVALALQQ